MKFIKIFLTVTVILLTMIFCMAKPSLHKQFVITGANFKLERYSEKAEAFTTKLNTTKQIEYGSNREDLIEPSVFLAEKDKKNIQNKDNNLAKNIVTENSSKDKEQTFVDKGVSPEMEDAFNEYKEATEKENKQIKKLTRKQEIIAWNKWRSDLHNQIMIKSEVSGTMGTIYYFSFNVDKKGVITNIKAFCTNPPFYREVDDRLIPTIKKMEHSSFLAFPEGSARKSVSFKGMFIVWDATMLSTPSDFNDIERVNVYE